MVPCQNCEHQNGWRWAWLPSNQPCNQRVRSSSPFKRSAACFPRSNLALSDSIDKQCFKSGLSPCTSCTPGVDLCGWSFEGIYFVGSHCMQLHIHLRGSLLAAIMITGWGRSLADEWLACGARCRVRRLGSSIWLDDRPRALRWARVVLWGVSGFVSLSGKAR